MSLLIETAVFVSAAVIAAPLFKKLCLGVVLRFIAAGIVIGAHALGLAGDAENIRISRNCA